MEQEKTLPRPLGAKPSTDADLLLVKRYGTQEMGRIWGPEQTIDFSLLVQGRSATAIAHAYPEVVPLEQAIEIMAKAGISEVPVQRVMEIEEETGHDVIGINSALQEQLSREAAMHVNKFKTSADTTENAKALQLSRSLEVVIGSVENLRDIVLERAIEWIDVPHQDMSHWYDAVPTVAGRPLVFYAETLQSDLTVLKFVYQNSIVGKWADATGNHHSASAVGVDGMLLQESLCDTLGLRYMQAPAQIPAREFIADVVYSMARLSGTITGLAKYVRWGRSDDVGLFTFPLKKKGSSAMPHKTAKGGNPTAEEQAAGYFEYMNGILTTAIGTIPFEYARDLKGSAVDRINLEGMFKFGDHVIRRMAGVIYKLILDEKRSRERVARTFGVTTAQQVMTYLTDQRLVDAPMTRDEAHTLTGKLATTAYGEKRSFYDVCAQEPEVTNRLDDEILRKITDPFKYIGMSKEIIRRVHEMCYKKKTL